MSLHVNRFVDRIRSAESRQQRDIVLTINEARDLHADITKLLLAIETLRDKQVDTPTTAPTISGNIELDGGTF